MRSATKNKTGKDAAYLAWLHNFPCVVCVQLNVPQTSPTEAAHVGPRGLSQKCPDRVTLPLCREHHREGQFSQHSMGKMFWPHFDLELNELLLKFQCRYESERLGVLNPLDVIGVSA